MSAITYSINKVKLAIPKKILDLAFITRVKAYRVETTIDKQINDLVINPIVLKDINIIGGTTIKIPLNRCYIEEYILNEYTTNVIIKVPYNLLNNRKITMPLSLTINTSNSDILLGNKTMLNESIVKQYNHVNADIIGTVYTNLELLSGNTILVQDNVPFTSNGLLEVIIENATNLSNIKPKSYIAFSKLVILATKAYIYNTLILELESGALYYGHDLSKMADIITSYESALEEYDTFLKETWAKVSFINDSTAYDEYIRMLVSPNL